jgi:hypothetical protein
MLTFGKGKYKVWLKKQKIGADLVYFLGGGQKPHIGGAVVCTPGEKPKIVKLEDHYDYVVLKPIAEAACKKYKKTVVAIGGIHIDNASKKEIDLVVKNCHSFVKKI